MQFKNLEWKHKIFQEMDKHVICNKPRTNRAQSLMLYCNLYKAVFNPIECANILQLKCNEVLYINPTIYKQIEISDTWCFQQSRRTKKLMKSNRSSQNERYSSFYDPVAAAQTVKFQFFGVIKNVKEGTRKNQPQTYELQFRNKNL